MKPTVLITNRTRAAVDSRWLTRQLRASLRILGITCCHWTITIVGDRAMSALHQKTMQLPTTTDVLTFDMRDDPPAKTRPGEPVELDTVICRDEAARRAGEFGHDLRRELLLYAIHSLLHVQGFDDITAAAAKRMHAREDAILTRLGIGPVYAKGAT